MKTYYPYLIVIIIIFGCENNNDQKSNKKCEAKIESFLNKYKSHDFDLLYGITAAVRGRDKTGSKVVRPIEFTNKNKESFVIPSIPNTNYHAESDISLDSLAIELGYDRDSIEVYLKSIYEQVKIIINNTEVVRIHSQNHLGEFVEFKFYNGCSLWYKKPNAIVDKQYFTYFMRGQKLEDNWYKIERKRTKPVLKKYPPNVKIKGQ